MRMVHLVIAVVLVTCFVGQGSSLRCGKTSEFDNQDFFSCPRPYDDRDAVFCCGNKCCKSLFEADNMDVIGKSNPNSNLIGNIDAENTIPNLNGAKAEKRSLVKGLASIVGIVIGVVLFVVIFCVICCCCCPFCLIAKRRKAGRVLRTGNASAEAARMNPQQQGYLPPPQQQQQSMATYPLPLQQQGYVSPRQGYPYQQQQQQQPYAYPVQGGAAVAGYPGPYPVAPNVPMPSYPPPYTHGGTQLPPLQHQQSEGYNSQPAYNPNF